MASSRPSDIKAHVCPPSAAIHPADRWESLFVYSFICKFTNLRHKVEGLETPMEYATTLQCIYELCELKLALSVL